MNATYACDGPFPFGNAEQALRALGRFANAMAREKARAYDEGRARRSEWQPPRGGHRPHRGGPGGPGFPFGGFGGPGFPFGGPPPWMQGRPPFGRGRRARRGDVRAAALSLLAEEPLNGYQIIQRLAERSGGAWRPSSGAVYPALQQLTDEGLVRAVEQDGKRVFHLTDEGRAYVEEHQDELAAPWEAVADHTPDAVREIQHLALQAGAALAQVITTGDEQQVAQARQLLIETRKGLYRILAEDDPGGGSAGSDARPTDTGPSDTGPSDTGPSDERDEEQPR